MKYSYRTLVIFQCTTVRSKSGFAAHHVANDIAYRKKPRITGENVILPATIHTFTTQSLVPNTLQISLRPTLLPAEFQTQQNQINPITGLDRP
jgi:hypothetical protein